MRTFLVELDLNDIIECHGIDGFNELVEDAATNKGEISDSDILEDISYRVYGKGSTKDMILVEVTCDVIDDTDFMGTLEVD